MKKSRKYNKKTIKTRKQRGGFANSMQAQAQQQEGGSWFSGITEKVKGLFSIDHQQHEEPTVVQQAIEKVKVPQPEVTNMQLNKMLHKNTNLQNNRSI